MNYFSEIEDLVWMGVVAINALMVLTICMVFRRQEALALPVAITIIVYALFVYYMFVPSLVASPSYIQSQSTICKGFTLQNHRGLASEFRNQARPFTRRDVDESVQECLEQKDQQERQQVIELQKGAYSHE